MDDNKEKSAEAEVAKALAGLQATNAALRAELSDVKSKMTAQKAQVAFTEAMEKADARPQAKEFGLRLLMSELRNVRLTDDGGLVASLGDLEGATPEELVTAFVAQNEFLQKVVTADGLDVSAIIARPVDTAPLQREYATGPAHQMMDTDEMFAAAGLPPEKPKPKATPPKPLTEQERSTLTLDELYQRAGEAPWQR